MVVTCLAILAVDFKIFPRRFAKVETWGTSLMDMGVGSFVFSAGLMSKKSMNLRHSIPLLVLGFIRLYSVKGLDYAEHVTEYGVHWNFFFTLALLPPSVTLLPRFSPHFMALVISCLYQATLEFTSLKVWILTASRDNLFSQNREGLFSFFGYLAIFLIGQSIGLDVLPRNRNMKRLFLWSAWFNLLLFLTRFDISRRLANLPYVLWVSAFNCSQLTLFSAIETSSTSLILGAFNRNGLVIFLLANLLTGLINLSMDTLHVNKITSMIVLSIYISILTIIATTLHVYKISIKF